MRIFKIVTVHNYLHPEKSRFNEWVFERCMRKFERLAAVNVLQSDQKHQSCIPSLVKTWAIRSTLVMVAPSYLTSRSRATARQPQQANFNTQSKLIFTDMDSTTPHANRSLHFLNSNKLSWCFAANHTRHPRQSFLRPCFQSRVICGKDNRDNK